MASHISPMTWSRPRATFTPRVIFSRSWPSVVMAAMRRLVPPRSTPMEKSGITEESTRNERIGAVRADGWFQVERDSLLGTNVLRGRSLGPLVKTRDRRDDAPAGRFETEPLRRDGTRATIFRIGATMKRSANFAKKVCVCTKPLCKPSSRAADLIHRRRNYVSRQHPPVCRRKSPSAGERDGRKRRVRQGSASTSSFSWG